MLDYEINSLAISTNVRALIIVNGTPLGETDSDESVCIPVSDSGEYYAVAYPMEYKRLYVPKAVCVAFEAGKFKCSVGTKAYLWQNGATEIFVELDCAEYAVGQCRACEIDSLSPIKDSRKLELTLMRDESMYLLCETHEHTRSSFMLGSGIEGRLSQERISGETFVAANIRYAAYERLLLFDWELNNVLDIASDKVNMVDGLPCTVERLVSYRGHERRVKYDYANGGFFPLTAEIGFFTRQAKRIADKAGLTLAFFDAIRLEFANEALGYISSELQTMLDFEKLKGFIGDFSSVRLPRGNRSGAHAGVCTARKDETNVFDVTLFAIEQDSGRITNIEKV